MGLNAVEEPDSRSPTTRAGSPTSTTCAACRTETSRCSTTATSSTPQYSRGLEYQLDEAEKTATLVWQYEAPGQTFGGFMGGVQGAAGGGQLLCWGGVFGSPLRVTDLHADGSVALELGLPPNTFSYRAYRHPWRSTLIWTDEESLDFGVVPVGPSLAMLPFIVRNRAARSVTIDCAVSTDPRFAIDTPLPVVLAPGDSAVLTVAFDRDTLGAFATRLYLRSTGEAELVAAAVDIRAEVFELTGAPTSPAGALSFEGVRPNPAGELTAFSFDLAQPGHVTLEVIGVDGRRVVTVVSGTLQAGRHEIPWRTHGLAGGMYFARLAANGRTVSRRFVHIE